MGDQPEWGRLVPRVWQALADPEGTYTYPGESPTLEAATARWSPLLHVLWFSLGWPRPDIGLRRWYDEGQPTDDSRLALLKEVWGSELDLFSAWCWEGSAGYSQALSERLGTRPDHSPVPAVDARWLDQLEELRSRTAYGPWGGGSDPLHLGSHAISAAGELPREPRPPVLNPTNRRAALVLDGYQGWYSELAAAGAALPPLPGDSSWRVDVLVKPVGWLGSYRLSPRSGRWFAGRHWVHEMGCGDR
jgi:hypothetical protein